MRKIPGENLTANGKSIKNKTPSKGKTMFGYNVLGFGAGGSVFSPFDADYLIVAGGGPGGSSPNGGGGAGGHRSSFPGGTKITLDAAVIPITVGAGGPAGSGSSGTGISRGEDSTIGLVAGNFSSSAGGAG